MIRILSYSFNESLVISIFEIKSDLSDLKFNLKIPSNPYVEIDILQFENKNELDILIKLDNIINNKIYSKETLEELQRLKIWVYNIYSNESLLSH